MNIIIMGMQYMPIRGFSVANPKPTNADESTR